MRGAARRCTLAMLAMSLVLNGCALRAPANLAPAPADPDTTHVLRLISAHGLGQGCPISETRFLTARHVATLRRPVGPAEFVSLLWSDAYGHTGSAWTLDVDFRRDLALMQSDRPFAQWYPLARMPPTPGDHVVIVGFDYDDRLRPQVLRVKVLNVVSAHLVLSRGGEPGFSGSCVLDTLGHVVGVFVWGVGASQPLGVAIGVWGPWSDVSWLPPERQE